MSITDTIMNGGAINKQPTELSAGPAASADVRGRARTCPIMTTHIPTCSDCLRPAYAPDDRVRPRGVRRKRCPACRRQFRAWMQRRYWWHRGGAQRHKHNGLRRERVAQRAERRRRNKLAWDLYNQMMRPPDWPSFRAAALDEPMPAAPQGFKVRKL